MFPQNTDNWKITKLKVVYNEYFKKKKYLEEIEF